MYKVGATLLADIAPVANVTETTVTVDDTSDFVANSQAVLFDRAGSSNVTIKSIVSKTEMKIEGLDRAYTKYSGFKKDGQEEVYDLSFQLSSQRLKDAFGGNITGTDGGVFVEFKYTASTTKLPKYAVLPGGMDKPSFYPTRDFMKYWLVNRVTSNNFIQVVMADTCAASFAGGTNLFPYTGALVFVGALPEASVDAYLPETYAHEIGHTWLPKGKNGHVDLAVNARNHSNDDECLMCYNREDADGIAEFDTACIYTIRDAVDGLFQT